MTTLMTTCAPPLPAHPRGPWLGWSISLLVHAGVLAWLAHAWQVAPPNAAPARRMHFVLVPPKPQAEATVPVATEPAAKQVAAPTHAPRNRPAPAVAASASSSTGDSATPAEPAAAIAPDTSGKTATNVPAPAEPDTSDAGANAGDATPHLDVKAARATARLVEKHRKDGLVAFPKPDPPLHRDDHLERAIERAHRSSDCKTAYSGMGLLAVIPLAKDTLTGTGCRW